MSQENVEMVRASFDAFSRGDLEGVLDDFAPEFEFHPSGRFMDTQRVYRGREGWVDSTLSASSSDGWQVTGDVPLYPELGGTTAGGRQVALRFVSSGDQASWLIDNVYVDPKRL